MKTFLFPGQGSQSRDMGGTLFEEFADLTLAADRVLGYSIKELCLQDPRGELNKTQFTQPALFVVGALSYLRKLRDGADKPNYFAGHSLGEFNALFAAECFDFEVGLRLVQKRGELMSRATNGGMAAIINATKDQIESILASNGLTQIDIANYNSPSQIVISGSLEEVGRAQPLFQQGKMLFYPLNTSGAFHSRFMREAEAEFEVYLNSFTFRPPSIPVIANFTARAYEADKVAWTLARQITGTVRWSESMTYLMALASAVSTEMQFEEIGHGDVLTKLIRNIKRHAAKPEPRPAPTGSPAATAVQKPAPSEPRSTRAESASPSAAPRFINTAPDKVKAWNSTHPIGTKIRASILDDAEFETRTEAMLLFDHRAAVYVKGHNGYFDLDEITPA